MIKSIKHKGLKRLFYDDDSRGVIADHADKLKMLLFRLDHAEEIEAMDIPGANLHQLKGKLADHWSLKVNGNWRLTFKFENGDATIVDYQDYH